MATRRRPVQWGELCLACRKPIDSECVEATVDDGRPAGTPNRWRTIGYTHDGRCTSEFDRGQQSKADENNDTKEGQ